MNNKTKTKSLNYEKIILTLFIVISLFLLFVNYVNGEIIYDAGSNTTTNLGFSVYDYQGQITAWRLNLTDLSRTHIDNIEFYISDKYNFGGTFNATLQTGDLNIPSGNVLVKQFFNTNQAIGYHNFTINYDLNETGYYWLVFSADDSNTDSYYRIGSNFSYDDTLITSIVAWSEICANSDWCGSWIYPWLAYENVWNIKVYASLPLSPIQLENSSIISGCNQTYTKDETNTYSTNISIGWSFVVGSDYYNLYNNNLLCNTTELNCSFTTNNISFGLHELEINSLSDFNNESINTETNCFINICQNNWLTTPQPCINGYKLLTYYDSNNCSLKYNIPITNNTYNLCIVPATDGENKIANSIYFLGLIILIIILIHIYEGDLK